MYRQETKKTRAQATLETALMLPILLTLVFAIISIGWWMNVQQIATNAASEAAAIGAASNDNCQIISVAQGVMKNIARNIDLVEIGIDPKKAADRPPGTILKVQIKYPLGFKFGFSNATGTSKFGTVIANSIVRMDYYSADGLPKVPGDPQCAGEI